MRHLDQSADILIAIKMRRSPANVIWQQLWRRHFGARINRAQVFSEAPNRGQTTAALHPLDISRLRGHCSASLGGDEPGSFRFCKNE